MFNRTIRWFLVEDYQLLRHCSFLPPWLFLDLSMVPDITLKIKEIPVISCFALMLAFEQPLSLVRSSYNVISCMACNCRSFLKYLSLFLFSRSTLINLKFPADGPIFSFISQIPVKGFSFKNSNILSWAFCDSSKPGRSTAWYVLVFAILGDNGVHTN